ncbi:MAG TPA: PfkB family carbohydrate kinase [Pyrinomonadaceae bacterium]|nr:PfkB family carbohydrate kinase [Pyrinomonadaceae bacterium]
MQFPFTLPENKEFDVLGFGTNAVDHLIVVPEYPQFDSKIHLTTHIQAAGGQIASCMAGVSRLGFKAAYAGRFGSDREGAFGLQSLSDEGVDTRFSETIEGARTQIAFILIDERNGERTVIWHRDSKLEYSAGDAPIAAAGLAKVLHADAHDPFAVTEMAKAARAGGAIVTIDIDEMSDGVAEMLPLVDVLISSVEFPEKLTGIRDRRTALAEIRSRFGCTIVGSTKGVRGSSVLVGDTYIKTPAYDVPGGCVDTTGAGDAFRVGLIYGLLKGAEIEESLKYANAVAALKCRQLGARTALPTENEVFSLINSQ